MILTSHQPNFLPYMGVFYKAFKSDVLVLSDDVCYSKKGMHNWNRIQTKAGEQKITVPVNAHHDSRLCDISISDPMRNLPKICRTIKEAYARANHFSEGMEIIDRIEALSREDLRLVEDLELRPKSSWHRNLELQAIRMTGYYRCARLQRLTHITAEQERKRTMTRKDTGRTASTSSILIINQLCIRKNTNRSCRT